MFLACWSTLKISHLSGPQAHDIYLYIYIYLKICLSGEHWLIQEKYVWWTTFRPEDSFLFYCVFIFTYLFVYSSVHPPIHSSIHPSIHPFFQQSFPSQETNLSVIKARILEGSPASCFCLWNIFPSHPHLIYVAPSYSKPPLCSVPHWLTCTGIAHLPICAAL